MKTLAIILSAGAIVFLGWRITQATDNPQPRKFGPEWTKDPDGANYRRKMEVEVTHSAGGNIGGCNIALDHNTIMFVEIDNNAGYEVRCNEGRINVLKDDKGKARELTVRLNKNSYFDLDGDGMIDAMYDSRGDKRIPMVLFEGRFVQVEDFISGFSTKEMWGIGRKVKYVFKGSAWVEVPLK